LHIKTVHSILEANAKNELPDEIKSVLVSDAKLKPIEHSFENVVGQDSLTRFDKRPKPKGNLKPNKGTQGKQQQRPNPNQNAANKQNNVSSPKRHQNNNQSIKAQGSDNVDKPSNQPNRPGNHQRNKKFNKSQHDKRNSQKNEPPKTDV
jgi:hypothetical protein